MTGRLLGTAQRALRLPPAERRLVVEAAFELTRASVALKVARRKRVVGLLGNVDEKEFDEPVNVASAEAAKRLGAIVVRVASRLPWKPSCLRQGVAAQQMLHRRGIPARLHLGVAPPREAAAHAWVTVGGDPVVGGYELDSYAQLAAFELKSDP
jgi:hypothetical protein